MKVKSIIIKDLKIILSDKKALAIMILMPIILTTILSMALKGSFAIDSSYGIDPVNIAVVKLYDEKKDDEIFKSILSRSFIAQEMDEDSLKDLADAGDKISIDEIFFEDFLNSEDISEYIRYSIEDETSAMKLLGDGEVSAVVFLPEKFSYDMKINMLTPFRNKIDIRISTHPDRSVDGQIVKSVMDAYANVMSSAIIGKNVMIEAIMANDLGGEGLNDMDKIIDGMTDVLESVDINIEDVVLEGREPVSSADYYAAAMMTMFILFAAGQGGRMLLEEKDNLTYQRMVVAGTKKAEILSGKFITMFIIALFQIFVMTVYTHFALKVDWGDTASVILISLSAALAIAGLGTFVGALTYNSGNYKMANIFESIIIQGMALLGGSFFPLDVMPDFMQKLSFLSINGVALKAYLKVLTGLGMADVLNYILVLIAAGATFTAAAVIVLSRKEGNTDVKHNKAEIIKA